MDVFWAAALENRSVSSLPAHSPAFACARILGLPRKQDRFRSSDALFLARVGTHISASDLACVDTCAALRSFLRAQARHP